MTLLGRTQVSLLPPRVQRACSCGGCTGCTELQRRASGPGRRPPDTSLVNDVLRAPSQSLDPATRALMESRLSHDFGQVRVHTDARAAASADALGAHAYTVGRDIVFAAGRYAPSSLPGQRLLAHELTHTVQQGHARDVQRAALEVSDPDDPAEREAERVAEGFLASPAPLHPAQEAAGPAIHRLAQSLPIVGPLFSLPHPASLVIGRALTPRERDTVLRPVFGMHLNYAIVRICEAGLCSPDKTERTVGNLIGAPPGITDHTLVHEAAHVWQHQNGVPFEYAADALISQLGAWAVTGSRSAAYDWRPVARLPWRRWNAEQQAQWIADNRRLPRFTCWALGGLVPP